MNIRDLQYLTAVAKYRHFGKAAKACFVSQPALSMQLKKLEDELGVQLFERTHKSVMITDVGRDIAERSGKILREVEEIKDVVRSYQQPFAGKFTLGAFPTLAPYFLPKAVMRITAQLPQLKLLLVEEKTDILLEKLSNGGMDAALLALPVDNDSLEYSVLLEDEFLLAMPASHRLAGRKSVTRDDLKNESLLLLEEGHCLRQQALDVCSLIGMSERQEFRATSLETLRQMVAANVGITLIPRLAQRHDDGLIYIPFKQNAPSRTIALVWRKTSARKECMNRVAAIIKE